MDATFTRPKLRWPLDIRMHNLGGQEALVIQCPIGISTNPLCLVPQLAPVVADLDGVRTSEELVQKFGPHGLTTEVLRQLIQHLDDHLFLSNARFFAAEKIARDAFASASVRPAALAGSAYPLEQGSLSSMVQGYLTSCQPPERRRSLACLVAPHIDYRRGGACYGATYPRLSESEVDTYILIGTAHQYSRGTFHLCSKDFETPLGTHPCDKEMTGSIARRYGIERAFADQYLHRREHSLELQLPFLSTVKPQAKVVPILVGSFHHMIEAGRYPHENEAYESFAGSLTEALRDRTSRGERIAFIAGVDMAHVGRSFGDPGALSPEQMRSVRSRDEEYLRAIELGDHRALFDHIAEDLDARRICGFPTMYLVLDVLRRSGIPTSCDVVAYDQAVDYEGDCAVTFAGLAIHQDPAKALIVNGI